jgi:hypothetical protein
MPEVAKNSLVPLPRDTQESLRHALRLWAEAATAPSTERREELQTYKQKAVASFFSFINKHPGQISPLDVEDWRKILRLPS